MYALALFASLALVLTSSSAAPIEFTVMNASNTGACPAGKVYYASLYDQSGFNGNDQQLSGVSGTCIGLNETPVKSAHILASHDGDPWRQRVAKEFAGGVTLTYFSDFACGGSVVASTVGDQDFVFDVDAPKSVQIACNGQGSGSDEPLALPPPFGIKIYDQPNYQGYSYVVSGSYGECVGLGDTSINSFQYLNQTTGLPFGNYDSYVYAMVFYDEYGCTGNKVDGMAASRKTLSKTIYAKSARLMASSPAPEL